MVQAIDRVPGSHLDENWPFSHANLSVPALVEQSLRQGNAHLAAGGAVVAETRPRTGRSPKDKYIVRDAETGPRVAWGGATQPIEPDVAGRLEERVAAYLRSRETFVVDAWAGADPAYRLGVRVVAEYAWHALFARQLFLSLPPADRGGFEPGFTVLVAPEFVCQPERDGMASDAAIVLDFGRRVVTIAGTRYAGEIKKSVFSYLNYVLPGQGVLPMHCSANLGPAGDVALFFGLSGTGKTTLSADPGRALIGDDEHGWSDNGVFNFEGGCYAKCINLQRDAEPQIYDAIRFGAVLENVVMDPYTAELEYADDSITENTRAAYPLSHIAGAAPGARAGHPATLVLLTADAFGVLPPIAHLTIPQAVYYFLSGYTAKLAGTEAGLGSEPEATFSTCFASPFIALPPTLYAGMLRQRIEQHGTRCYLVNTGWTGGPFGTGRRVPLAYTRAMVRSLLAGTLDDVPTVEDPIFGLRVPRAVTAVPEELLSPRLTWADQAAYDRAAAELAGRFRANFRRFADVEEDVAEAGPRT